MSPHHFYCHRSCWVNKAVLVTQTQTREGLSLSPGAGGGAGTIFLLSPLVGTDHYNGPHPTLCPPVTGNCHSKVKQRHGETQNIWRGSTKRSHTEWKVQSWHSPWSGLGRLRVSDNPGKCFARDEMCPISAEMRAMTRTGPGPATMIDRE